MTTRLWLRAALAAGVAAGFAGGALAQGGAGGGGRCGNGAGTSQLSTGSGTTATLRGSTNRGNGTSQLSTGATTAALLQGAANQSAMAQQLAYQQALINQLQAQLQALQSQSGQGQQTSPGQTAQLQTGTQTQPFAARREPPRQGPSRSDWSPVWTSTSTDLAATATVTPGQDAIPMAVSPPLLKAYLLAAGSGLEKTAQQYVDGREVVLVDSPLPVAVETKFRGLAYVRPTEGRFAGKFLVVDERYVK
jgi:hypothetical protein